MQRDQKLSFWAFPTTLSQMSTYSEINYTFVLILNNLWFSSNIIPSDLGSSWRPQQGCAPYIEYVTDFLLPRIFQSENQSSLYFASPADKFRLISRSLEAVDAVLCGYSSLETNTPRSVSPPGLITESSLSKDPPTGVELSPLKSIKIVDRRVHRSKNVPN